jgi:HK97 family phage prohead protease
MVLRIRGYFSVFNEIDRADQIVDPGAFSRFIAENPNTQLPIYYEHDHSGSFFGDGKRRRPVGATTSISQDSFGAYFEGDLLDTPKAAEIATLISGGAVRQVSFGYYIHGRYELDDIWHLSDLQPFEVTVAAIHAAQPLAYVEPIPLKEIENAPDAA